MPGSETGFKVAEHDVNSMQRKTNSTVCSVDYRAASRTTPCSLSLEGIQLGAMNVLRYEGFGLRGGSRSFSHIKADQADDFLITLPLRAAVRVSQSGSTAVVEPGSFAFVSTAKPFDVAFGDAPDYVISELIVRIPGPTLRQRVPHIDECCDRPVRIRPGSGHAMKSLIELALEDGNVLSASQTLHLGDLLLSAVAHATFEAPELLMRENLRIEQSHERIRSSAKTYIERNISNPMLSAEMVADHCGVSLRYLHKAFEDSPLKVGAFIRELRLQGCQLALQSPALRHRSLLEIAMKWGFASSNSFWRAYRFRFGRSPSEERRSDRQC